MMQLIEKLIITTILGGEPRSALAKVNILHRKVELAFVISCKFAN